MKKVIKQEKQTEIEVESFSENHITISQHGMLTSDEVVIEKTKAREIALAICPELQLELEKAKELFKYLLDVNGIVHESDADKVYTFLEGYRKQN